MNLWHLDMIHLSTRAEIPSMEIRRPLATCTSISCLVDRRMPQSFTLQILSMQHNYDNNTRVIWAKKILQDCGSHLI